MRVHLIWAQDHRGGIGKNGKLPWHISADLKNFKRLTLHHPVIMGRKTWESLPVRPLPGRRNIIISTRSLPDTEVYSSPEDAITALTADGVENVFVIGGSSIYKALYPLATDLHITLVEKHVEGIDTVFPENMETISDEFVKVEEKELTTEALYTRWVRR